MDNIEDFVPESAGERELWHEDTTRTTGGNMTLSEYFARPETLIPQELIYGSIHVADAPFVSHQRVVLRLATALQSYADRTYAGEVLTAPIDVVFDRRLALVLQPDVLFVSQGRMDMVRDRIYGAPDLVVEVLSPRPRIGDLQDRVRWFAHYGVREIWLYSQNEAELHVLQCREGVVTSRATFGTDDPISSSVLPGFDRTMRSVMDRG